MDSSPLRGTTCHRAHYWSKEGLVQAIDSFYQIRRFPGKEVAQWKALWSRRLWDSDSGYQASYRPILNSWNWFCCYRDAPSWSSECPRKCVSSTIGDYLVAVCQIAAIWWRIWRCKVSFGCVHWTFEPPVAKKHQDRCCCQSISLGR